MRNNVHWLLLLFLSQTAFGQLEKGRGLLTGSFNGSFDQYKSGYGTFKPNRIQAATTVSYGVFVKNNVLVGAAISLAGNQAKNATDQIFNYTVKSHGTSASISPFARYYWQYGKLLIYAGGGFTLAESRSAIVSDNDPTKADTRDFSASLDGQAGLIYPLSNRIGVEVYAHSSNLPVSVSTAGVGLILFTGARNQLMTEDTLTKFSQLRRGKVVLSTGFSTMRTHETSTTPQDSGRLANSDYKHNLTTVSIGIGYFVRDRTQIGIYASYSVNDTRLLPSQAYRYSSVSITPYGRHYLSKTALTPYIAGSLSLAREIGPAASTYTYTGRLSTGLAYMAGKRFIIEADLISLQASTASSENVAYDAVTNQSNVIVNATLRPNLVLSYVFR